MAIHWQIPFRSLRNSVDYQVNIYDASYNDDPIVLKGGAQPFTTEESDDEDFFIPVRTQSGYIRIVDDGKDANGNTLTADWWKAFAPTTDTARPVTLTKTVLSSQVVVWQGFMQAQDFTGELYKPTQEREFPVQCALSVLSADKITIPLVVEPKTFAYLLLDCVNKIDLFSGGTVTSGVVSAEGAIHITDIYVQGGADAQGWLMKYFDWANLLNTDTNGEYESAYTLLEALEDMCRFWGWTARVHERILYLMCPDDTTETTFLKLTRSNLVTLANGLVAGTTTDTFVTTTISGDVFASTNNNETKVRGYSKCTVKGNVNNSDYQIKFAPKSVEDIMERKRTGDPATGYAWFNFPALGDEPGVGYFSTARVDEFDVSAMYGKCSADAGFYRRQIYSDVKDDNPNIMDMIAVWSGYSGSRKAWINTKRKMLYSGGSIKIEGSIYHDAHLDENFPTTLVLHVGIGESYANAKWWYLNLESDGRTISHGWSSDIKLSAWSVDNGNIKGATINQSDASGVYAYSNIPCDANGLYGYLYIDVIGCYDANGYFLSFEVANLSITYSRDTLMIPTSTDAYRQREVVTDRVITREYSAGSTNKNSNPLNIDCIYVSDNQMKYGLGLIMNNQNAKPSDFMVKANYGNNIDFPEQHLANRVAAFWAQSRSKYKLELRSNTIGAISPRYKVFMNSEIKHPVAISYNWCDDIMLLTLM